MKCQSDLNNLNGANSQVGTSNPDDEIEELDGDLKVSVLDESNDQFSKSPNRCNDLFGSYLTDTNKFDISRSVLLEADEDELEDDTPYLNFRRMDERRNMEARTPMFNPSSKNKDFSGSPGSSTSTVQNISPMFTTTHKGSQKSMIQDEDDMSITNVRTFDQQDLLFKVSYTKEEEDLLSEEGIK